jgi:PLD-like domain
MPRRRSWLAAVGAILAAATTVPSLQACTALPDQLDNSVVFNDPLGSGDPNDAGGKYAIQKHIIDLINDTAAGETIRLAMYEFWSNAHKDALIAAYRRGVNVQVVADSVSAPEKALSALQSAIGKTSTHASFAITCADGVACVGAGGINHDKFVLFSSVRNRAKVFIQSSANMLEGSAANSGINAWNNAVTIVDEPAVYDAYVARFTAMRDQVAGTAYASTTGVNAEVYFFPRSTGNTMVDILGNVDCLGTNTSGGDGANHLTVIKVAVFALADVDIARKLWRLDNEGCVVDVARTNSGHRDDKAIAVLKNCTAHNGVLIRSFHLREHDDNDPHDVSRIGYLHSKYLLIDGYYDGSPNQHLIWTGSYNYAGDSLRDNDEALLALRNRESLFSAYQNNFDTLLDRADYTDRAGDC